MSNEIEERSRVLGWPLLTALGGIMLLAVASMLIPAIMPRTDLSTLLTIGAGTGLVLWLIVLLVGTLEKVAEANSRRRGERAARLSDAVAASELSMPAKDGVRMIVVPEAADAILANEIETIRAAREQCDLLARRTWNNSGGYVGFINSGDWTKFRKITARRLRAAEELGRLQRAETERSTAGREMVREELSR